jgi:hypothetical protein
MIELTPDARMRFDDYLRRIRAALSGTRAVEPAEVEQNVIEHVEVALAGVPAPIGSEPLRAVLEQLGPPERWLPEEEQPLWRRMMGKLTNGPEDWRLAYLSFAVTAVMLLFFPVGGVVLLPIAFLMSRAVVQLVQEKGETLGARAWLVVPPIAIAFLLFLAAVLFGMAALPVALAEEEGWDVLGLRHPTDRADWLRMFVGLIALSGGVWWVVLSGLFALLFRPIRWLFAPILNKLRRVHFLWLTAIGIVGAGLGAVLLWVWVV